MVLHSTNVNLLTHRRQRVKSGFRVRFLNPTCRVLKILSETFSKIEDIFTDYCRFDFRVQVYQNAKVTSINVKMTKLTHSAEILKRRFKFVQVLSCANTVCAKSPVRCTAISQLHRPWVPQRPAVPLLALYVY